MDINELQVRLLHAAKTKDQWKVVAAYPKKGEVCLEATTATGATSFKIKIGDGTRPYCRNTGTPESPVWDFTSDQVLPYFGTTVVTDGTVSVVSIGTYTEGSSIKKKLVFYPLSLASSTVEGVTTLSPVLGTNPYLEVREGTGIEFTVDETGTPKLLNINISSSYLNDTITSAINALDTPSPLNLAEWDSSTNILSLYSLSETNGIVSKSSTAIATIDLSGIAPVQDVQVNSTSILSNGVADIAVDGTYNSSTNKIATESTVSSAITDLDVAGYGQATIDTTTSNQTTLTVKGIKEDNGKIATDSTQDVNIVMDGTYNATYNKVATQTTVSNAIVALDGIPTTVDTTNSTDVITTVSENNGVVSSTKKTIVEGNKIDINVPTTGTSTGDIIISHEDIDTTAADVASTITTDSSSTVDEKELNIITGIKVDPQGHITHIDKDKSTNLIAADIKAPVEKTDDSMWTYRTTAGTTTIVGKDVAEVEELKGKTLKWQQLVQNGNFADGTVGWSTVYGSATVTNGILKATKGSSSDGGCLTFRSLDSVDPSHKYYIAATIRTSDASYSCALTFLSSVYASGASYAVTTNSTSFVRCSGIGSPADSTRNNICFRVGISSTPAGVYGEVDNIVCFDLTEMFGSTVADTMTVAQFEALYPLNWYNYTSTPQLNNVSASGIKTTGFNQFNSNDVFGSATGITKTGDDTWQGGTYSFTDLGNIWENKVGYTGEICISGELRGLIAGTNFRIKILYTDGTTSDNVVTITNRVGKSTVGKVVKSVRFDYDNTGNVEVKKLNISFSWSGYRDGEYEPYEEHTLYFNGELGSLATITGKKLVSGVPTGESVTIFTDGMKSVGSVYDFGKVDSDGYIKKVTKRIGSRAYTSGDESDTSVITDGSTTTYYVLATSEEYLLDTPIPVRYLVNDYGTEMLLPQGVDTTTNVPYTVPFSGIIKYQSNFKDVVLDTIDKVNNYKNPVKSKDNVDQTTGKVAIYDSDSTVESSTYEISNNTIDPEGTLNTTTIPTVDAVVDYVEDVIDTEVTVKDITTTDDDTSGNGGIRITSNGTTYDVHHANITQTDTTKQSTEEIVANVVTNVTVDSFGHVKGKEVISSDKLVAADIKAPIKQTDNSTWNHRITGGDISIGEDTAKILVLKGNTIVWNQLVDSSTSSVTLTSGNKYYTVIDETKSIQTGAGSAISVTGGTDMVINLTKMFGSDNQIAAALGVTVAEITTNKAVQAFEKLFPNDYYEYNGGELVSLDVEGVKSIGFNQWDEELELGDIGNRTGQETPSSTRVRSNFIPVIAGQNYYFKSNSMLMFGFIYDANKTFIGAYNGNNSFSTSEVLNLESMVGDIITMPENCCYLRFKSQNNITTYNHDICINISDPAKNGTYKPYKQDTLDLSWIKDIKDSNDNQLFPYGLLSAGSVYDEVTESKAVKRITSRAYQSGDESDSTVITDGTTTYYPLTAPIEIDIYPAKNMSYLVNDLGTETQLPINPSASTPIIAPFVGTFEYKSNFKDTVIELIDKVNNAANPVKGINNTDQTVGKIAVYDSERTTHSSNYSASNATIVEGATGNDIILPAVETIVNYVNSKLSSALTYKGTISEWADLPTSGQSTGDMYIADTTFTESGVTYQAGDFFIWNGTDWDIVSGTTSVVNSNPTLSLDGDTYQVGTVDGIALQVTTPNLDYSSPTASGTSLEYIDTVSQSNGLLSATKKSIPTASDSQSGVVVLSTGIENTTTEDSKVPTAYDALTNLNNRDVASGTITDDIATLSKRMLDEDSTSPTYESWINKTFYPETKFNAITDFSTAFGTNYPDLNTIEGLSTTGFLKRTGSNTWELTDDTGKMKWLDEVTNTYTYSAASTNLEELGSYIHNYYGITTIEKAVLDNNNYGFRIDVPILSSNTATIGKVLKGTKTTGVTTLPIWGQLGIEELSELDNLGSDTGYLKRKAGATAGTYEWELSTPDSTTVATTKNDGTETTSSSTAGPGIKVTTNGTTTYHKVPFSAICNDDSTELNTVTIILNGNFN